MKKIESTAMPLVFIIMLALAGCASSPDENVIKIGVIATQTGVGSYFGQQELRGAELAAEQINAAGGIKGKRIGLVVEDSQTKPTMAVSAMQKMIDENINFVIGDSWTSTTVSIVPASNENDVILISPIAVLDQLAADDFFFRTIPKTREMTGPLAEHAYYKMHLRNIAILTTQTQYGIEHMNDFREKFEELGGSIVAEELVDINEHDMRSALAKIKEKRPDGVFVVHAAALTGLTIKQAKELGMNASWLSSFSAENAMLLESYGEVSDGLVYPYPYDVSSGENVKVFLELYERKYGEIPDMTAADAYDALNVLAVAIQEVGEDPVAVKERLLKVQNYQGGSGTLSFDENGDVSREVLIKELRNGTFIKVG